MRLADRAEYRDYTIVNTSATDYIYNNYAKFIKFNSKLYAPISKQALVLLKLTLLVLLR
jgi:hypothetical protein